MKQLKLLIILGGLATLLVETYQCIYIWLPKYHEITTNSGALRFYAFLGAIIILTGMILFGSLLYALKNSLTGFVLLTIGASFLTPPYFIYALFSGLYYNDLLVALKVASSGIFAFITFLLAFYYKYKYENSVNDKNL